MSKSIPLHKDLGMNPRMLQECCGLCLRLYSAGLAMMGRENHKYICRKCGCVHYGKPEKNNKLKAFECAKCKHTAALVDFDRVELAETEVIKAGIGTCPECIEKLGETRVAFIEIKDGEEGDNPERTGNIFFFTPDGELKDNIEDRRACYVEESVAEKMGLHEKLKEGEDASENKE